MSRARLSDSELLQVIWPVGEMEHEQCLERFNPRSESKLPMLPIYPRQGRFSQTKCNGCPRIWGLLRLWYKQPAFGAPVELTESFKGLGLLCFNRQILCIQRSGVESLARFNARGPPIGCRGWGYTDSSIALRVREITQPLWARFQRDRGLP